MIRVLMKSQTNSNFEDLVEYKESEVKFYKSGKEVQLYDKFYGKFVSYYFESYDECEKVKLTALKNGYMDLSEIN